MVILVRLTVGAHNTEYALWKPNLLQCASLDTEYQWSTGRLNLTVHTHHLIHQGIFRTRPGSASQVHLDMIRH